MRVLSCVLFFLKDSTEFYCFFGLSYRVLFYLFTFGVARYLPGGFTEFCLPSFRLLPWMVVPCFFFTDLSTGPSFFSSFSFDLVTRAVFSVWSIEPSEIFILKRSYWIKCSFIPTFVDSNATLRFTIWMRDRSITTECAIDNWIAFGITRGKKKTICGCGLGFLFIKKKKREKYRPSHGIEETRQRKTR